MTREELINVIYKSSDKSATCPASYCLEFMVKDNCLKCAERLLAEYEKQIYNQALEDLVKKCEKAALYQFGQKYVDMRAIGEFKKELII